MNYTACELYFNKAVIKPKRKKAENFPFWAGKVSWKWISQPSGLLRFRSGIFLFQQLWDHSSRQIFSRFVLGSPPPLHRHCLSPGQAALSVALDLVCSTHHPPSLSLPLPPCPHCSAAASSQMPELPPGALTTQGPAVLWYVWMESAFGASVTRLRGWLIPSAFLVSAAWTVHLEDLKPLSCFWRSLPLICRCMSLIKPIPQPPLPPLTHMCPTNSYWAPTMCQTLIWGDSSDKTEFLL